MLFVTMRNSVCLWLHSLALQEPGTLWIHSVSQDVADSLTEKEKRRQEAINEVIYTERDFVRDMEYLREVSHLITLRRYFH